MAFKDIRVPVWNGDRLVAVNTELRVKQDCPSLHCCSEIPPPQIYRASILQGVVLDNSPPNDVIHQGQPCTLTSVTTVLYRAGENALPLRPRPYYLFEDAEDQHRRVGCVSGCLLTPSACVRGETNSSVIVAKASG
ncbi:hypothetical protein J6590_017328 [Homalodisca vitripennis]|nr:hypothetical protein J6590_017328 [Homalodisca vitripennis]